MDMELNGECIQLTLGDPQGVDVFASKAFVPPRPSCFCSKNWRPWGYLPAEQNSLRHLSTVEDDDDSFCSDIPPLESDTDNDLGAQPPALVQRHLVDSSDDDSVDPQQCLALADDVHEEDASFLLPIAFLVDRTRETSHWSHF